MATEMHRVPHLENPFEEKATEVESDRAQTEIRSSRTKRSSDRGRTSKQIKAGGAAASSTTTDEANMAIGTGDDAVDDSLAIFSMGENIEAEVKEPEDEDESDEDELDYTAQNDANHELDSNASNAGTDPETKVEDGRTQPSFEGVQRLKAELMGAEKEAAGIRSDPEDRSQSGGNRLVINEEEIQEALIQAAEDAMRYAYDESARRQENEESHYSNFEQHQLAEILVRQRQGLLRLEDLDHRMESMESKLFKVMSLIQQQQKQPTAQKGASEQQQLSSSSTAQQSSVPAEESTTSVAQPSSSSSDDPTLPSVQVMLSRGTGDDTNYQRYPYSWLVPGTLGSRIIDRIERIKHRSSMALDFASSYMLMQTGQESWQDVKSNMRISLKTFITRIVAGTVARLRSARTFIEERGLLDAFDGNEDRVLATAVLSALATLVLLYRYRQRRLQNQVEINSAVMAATLAPIARAGPKAKPITLIIT